MMRTLDDPAAPRLFEYPTVAPVSWDMPLPGDSLISSAEYVEMFTEVSAYIVDTLLSINGTCNDLRLYLGGPAAEWPFERSAPPRELNLYMAHDPKSNAFVRQFKTLESEIYGTAARAIDVLVERLQADLVRQVLTPGWVSLVADRAKLGCIEPAVDTGARVTVRICLRVYELETLIKTAAGPVLFDGRSVLLTAPAAQEHAARTVFSGGTSASGRARRLFGAGYAATFPRLSAEQFGKARRAGRLVAGDHRWLLSEGSSDLFAVGELESAPPAQAALVNGRAAGATPAGATPAGATPAQDPASPPEDPWQMRIEHDKMQSILESCARLARYDRQSIAEFIRGVAPERLDTPPAADSIAQLRACVAADLARVACAASPRFARALDDRVPARLPLAQWADDRVPARLPLAQWAAECVSGPPLRLASVMDLAAVERWLTAQADKQRLTPLDAMALRDTFKCTAGDLQELASCVIEFVTGGPGDAQAQFRGALRRKVGQIMAWLEAASQAQLDWAGDSVMGESVPAGDSPAGTDDRPPSSASDAERFEALYCAAALRPPPFAEPAYGDACAICLRPVRRGDRNSCVLRCGHVFHLADPPHCGGIGAWGKNCPNCRR